MRLVADEHQPPKSPKRPPPSLLPLVPLLLALLIPAVVMPPVFLYLLSKTVRPVLLTTAVVIPFSLFTCGWWAIGASFEGFTEPDTGGSWWATIGLRLGAVFTWLLAAWFARMLWIRRKRLHRTVSVVEVSIAEGAYLDFPAFYATAPSSPSVAGYDSAPPSCVRSCFDPFHDLAYPLGHNRLLEASVSTAGIAVLT